MKRNRKRSKKQSRCWRCTPTFARNHLALPVYHGEKTASERFPGAVQTLCIEAMVQDRKAIQAGTSHFLGQNFAKASNIKFISRDGTRNTSGQLAGARALAWSAPSS